MTIKELIVAKGNVKVYGAVEKISRKEGNSDGFTTVTSYGSADIREVTDVTPSKFSFKSEWDGVSQVMPTNNKIYTAAQLASYQSKQVNQEGDVSALAVTMPNGATLFADIDLKDYDWQGIVLAANQTFDGNKKTISNLSMTKPVLYETGVATHPACIGFFAAAQSKSIIKDITLSGVKVGNESQHINCKWVGSLVGHSSACTYTDCNAENVDLYCNTTGFASYRVGGLIGFISSGDPTLTGCNVTTANIVANFAYGGLIGSSLTSSITLDDCDATDITLRAGYIDETGNLGSVSKYIGDVDGGGGTRSVTITNFDSQTGLTEQDKKELRFKEILKTENSKTYFYNDENLYVGIVNSSTLTLTVNSVSKAIGTDFNKYQEVSYKSDGLPGYTNDGKVDWNN